MKCRVSKSLTSMYAFINTGTTPSVGSAPNSPARTTDSKFKRSLSFGGGATSSCSNEVPKPSTVVARPCESPSIVCTGNCFLVCPKQVDYLREMKEFESEMQKHSHRYPHDILL